MIIRLKPLLLLFGASAVCALAIGLPYWSLRYSQVNVPDALYGWGLLLVFVFAAAIRLTNQAGFLATTCAMALAVPVVVMARVVYETSIDPTSHNLWPLEVLIAGFVGVAVSVVGAGCGSFLRWVLHRNAQSSTSS